MACFLLAELDKLFKEGCGMIKHESGPTAEGEVLVLLWVELTAAGVVDGWKGSEVDLGP